MKVTNLPKTLSLEAKSACIALYCARDHYQTIKPKVLEIQQRVFNSMFKSDNPLRFTADDSLNAALIDLTTRTKVDLVDFYNFLEAVDEAEKDAGIKPKSLSVAQCPLMAAYSECLDAEQFLLLTVADMLDLQPDEADRALLLSTLGSTHYKELINKILTLIKNHPDFAKGK